MANSANTYLNVTELDFDEIRNNLKTYLSSQDQFTDYNFEGSSMSVLLDLLAYNTHYNSYYVNMLANEMFLDTAQQRDSVVSHAKLLGYTPISSIGPQANVTISFSGVQSGYSSFTLPKNSRFSTKVDDVTYTYVTPEAYIIRSDNNFSKDITIKEGEPLTHRFVVTDPSSQRFIIPNINVDTTSIAVSVQESSTDTTTTEFTRATNISQVFSTSPIYFIEESSDKKYELVFGSGALGKSLKTGNIIIVEYLVNNGDATNGANEFSIDSLSIVPSYSSVSLTSVNSSASGGREQETVKSIKFNAPRHYQTQNRCIIDNDYQRILISENPDLQSVISFGGEEQEPAIYGKVLIAAKPYSEKYLTETRKSQLRSSIIDRTPLGIDPLFIDADYTYIIPTVTTYYNKSKTTDSTSQIQSNIKTAIGNFSANNLERFNNRMRYSRFVRELDNTNQTYILNNDVSIKLNKRTTPNVTQVERLDITVNNPVRPLSLISSKFVYNGFECNIDDDGEGVIRIYRIDEQNRKKIYLKESAGTIDYDTGTINIPDFGITSYTGTYLDITLEPQNLDITPIREQILILDPEDATIKLIGESE